MGSRVQKIAFLVFALMFVAIMAVLNTSIITLATGANTQLTSVLSSEDSSITIYDQGKVYGATVITCAKAPSNVSETVNRIFVVNLNDVAGEAYKDGSEYAVTDSSQAAFVNKAAKYRSYLCENDNHVVTGILFVQEGAATTGVEALIDGAGTGNLTVLGSL